MKKANYDIDILFEKNSFLGISLGYDIIHEHEKGIRELEDQFGISSMYLNWCGVPRMALGLKSRMMRNLKKESLFYDNNNQNSYLIFHPLQSLIEDVNGKNEYINFLLNNILNYGSVLSTAWDDCSFGIYAKTELTSMYLKRIYEAFLRKDISFIYFNQTDITNLLSHKQDLPFKKGLNIVITSNIPKRIKKILKEKDANSMKLNKAVKKIGIKEKLSNHGKRWHALEPIWADKIKLLSKTNFPVVFWLQPTEQHLHNANWYTVEELLLWTENKGPIIK